MTNLNGVVGLIARPDSFLDGIKKRRNEFFGEK